MAWYSESQYYSTSNGISIVGIILLLALLLILIFVCIGICASIWWFLFKRKSLRNRREKQNKTEDNKTTNSLNKEINVIK